MSIKNKVISFALLLVMLLSLSLIACAPVDPDNGNGTQNGGTQNGGTQNGGTQNGGNQNGGNQNGGTTVHSHDYEIEEVLPTATAFGYRYKKCKGCSDEGTEILSPTSDDPKRADMTVSEYSLLAMKQSKKDAKSLFEYIKTVDQEMFFNYPMSGAADFFTIRDFALDLTKDCTTEREKAFAIHTWITSNIEYDEEAALYTVYMTFTEKKAVCFGYTALMHDMLAAVGIMSVYANGYSNTFTVDHLSDDRIYSESGEGASDGRHAWVLLYADGEVIACDPTWHSVYSDYDNGFDVPDEILAKTHLSKHINALAVVPEGVDERLYADIHKRIGNRIFSFSDGKLITGGASVVQNSITYNLITNADDRLAFNSIPNEIIANGFFKNSAQDFVSNDVNYWKYALPDGRSYNYSEMLAYVMAYNKHCSTDFKIDHMEEFSSDNNGFIYRIEGDGLTLISTIPSGSEITIPGEIDGMTVLKIGDNAFQNNSIITKITISDGIEVIGSFAFEGANMLESVVLPSTLKTIGSKAFGDTLITEITIPEGVTDMSGFYGTPFLKKINIPASVITEGNQSPLGMLPSLEIIEVAEGGAFKLIDGVLFTADGKTLMHYPAGKSGTSYTVPDGVEAIASSAFMNSKLESIILPDTLKKIHSFGFQWAESLTYIEIPNSVSEIGNYAFHCCTSLITAKMPEGITDMSAFFYQCHSLKSMHIGKYVKDLNWTFFDCENLESITIDEENPYFKLVDGVVYSADGKTLVLYPAKRSGTVYHVLEGTQNLAAYAISFTTELETVVLPEGFTELNQLGICFNHKIHSLVLPSTLKTMPVTPQINSPAEIFYNQDKDAIPSGVNIKPSYTVYYKGEWEMTNGIPTVIEK